MVQARYYENFISPRAYFIYMVKLGERLHEERKRQSLSIDEVAKATRIRAKFIEAIEKGEYKRLPSSAYAQGFVKNYVEFLGLPEKELLALFRREFKEEEFLGVLPQSFTQPKEISLEGVRIKRAGVIGVGILVVLLLYIFFQYKSAIFSPSLSVKYPPEKAVISTQTLRVAGTTDPNTTVTINNFPVFVDSSGNYEKEFNVFPGDVTITVKATNSFGKVSTVERHITVK